VNDLIELEGVIVKGRGLATKALSSDTNILNKRYNAKMTAGTINIVLTKPVNIKTNVSIAEIGVINKIKVRWFWEVKVDGQRVFLTRWPLCPFHIIEGISEFNFRDNGYKDGSMVKVEISKEWVEPLSSVQNIFWIALWHGRKELWYSSYVYWRIARMIRIKRFSGCCAD
jgi:hypothetical protein